MSFKPGDRIERYVIEALLGSGGMGEVYRAHDPRLKRAIALKILHAEAPADAAGATSSPVSNPAARMLREAQLAAAFEHPNVVHVYDVGQLEEPPELRGTTYLAMELIRGEPLRKYIGDAGVKMKTRVRWLEEIARALGAAHAAGLVHRDVKPENVVIRDDGVAKVLDFGVAKRTIAAPIDPTSSTEGFAIPTMTAHGVVVGTPMYMAPEQLRADPLDGRADQFAWGVVAYELLSGKGLWSLEGGGFSLVAQILSTAAPSLADVPGVPPRVAESVARALSKDPALRFPSMRELVEEMTGAVEGAESAARLPASRPSVEPSGRDVTQRATPPIAPRPTKESGPPAPPSSDTKRSARAHLPSADPPSGPNPQRRKSKTMLFAATAAAACIVAAWANALFRARSESTPPAARGAVSVASVSDLRACTSNAECTEREGTPSICRQRCVRIASPDCHASADKRALTSDATIWIGALYSLTGANASDGVINEHGTDLAYADFEGMGAALGPSARPLGLVTCDDHDDPSRAAHHLVDDLDVPAIVGFSGSAELTELASTFLIPNGVLSVACLTTSPLVTRLPRKTGDPPLVWRTNYSLFDAAAAVAALVDAHIEPELRADSVPRTRVALVRTNTPGALAFSERLFDVLHFNGVSALDNGGDYHDFVFDESTESYAAGLGRLRAFAPSIVVVLGNEGIVQNVLAPFERGSGSSGRGRTRYVDVDLFSDPVLRMVGHDRSLRRRFYGLTLPSTTPVNARFTMHFNETFGTETSRADAPSTAYDAFYLLGYASFALGGAPATGVNLARAIGHLVPPGPAVDVGPSAILEAFTRLSAGGSIDLSGTTGSLDYDLATGERPLDLSILCLDVNANGEASGAIESGAVFVGRSKQIVGRLKCP